MINKNEIARNIENQYLTKVEIDVIDVKRPNWLNSIFNTMFCKCGKIHHYEISLKFKNECVHSKERYIYCNCCHKFSKY